MDINTLLESIEDWHHARNLIKGSTDQAQLAKLISEVSELAANIAAGKCIKDDIGDCIVVLKNLAIRNKVSITECVETAWNDIKDRKGKMVDGLFVKEQGILVPAGPYIPEPIHIPNEVTHVDTEGYYYKKTSKFWMKWVNGVWIVMSGEPVLSIKEFKHEH